MDPAVLGTRLASSAIAPLLRKLLVREGAGAGLTDRPVRLSGLVSFRGEKRTLTGRDVRRIAAGVVDAAVAAPGEPPFPPDEVTAVTDALAARLLALGDLTMDDVQAVRLGHEELARRLRTAAPSPLLSTDAGYFLDSATEWACLHILQFFTQRSAFVARTLVEQSREQAELIARVDELIARTPRPDARDDAFEARYRAHLAHHHNRLTIFGLDLQDTPDVWPLDVAYLSLETVREAAPDAAELPDCGPGNATTTVRERAEDLFAVHDRILLRGDAGSGKTTLLQWLATTAEDRIPYVLPLRTLIRADRLPPPEAFLDSAACPHAPPEGWAERVLGAGRALVLVDGLDEVPSADRARVRDWLLALVRAYPGNRWLLTARPTAVRADWLADDGFAEVALAPMDRATVTAFVRRWHAAARAPEHEERLLDALRTKPDLALLATNPLMCGLLCALHRARRGYLPPRRKALYDAALQMILTERDRQRGMGGLDGIELDTEDQIELLQRLAYALLLAGRSEMSEPTALGILERALPSMPAAAAQGDAPAILRHLLLRSGVLRSPAPQVVDFAHRTFLDHLGARCAVEEGHLDVLISHADDTAWEDVIRMAVAHARTRERTSLLRALLDLAVPRVTLLALACLQDASSVDQEVVAEVKERAARLVPPRTVLDARALAFAGPFVLELLPGPEGLTDEEAYGVVTTASLLGQDGSLPVLKRFRTHESLAVRRQLVGTWRRFDADEYAREVLAHLPTDELTLAVTSDAQRHALRLLPPCTQLDSEGDHPPAALVSALATETASRLRLRRNSTITDLSVLKALPALTDLRLMDCPGVYDLAPLAELPLRHLSVIRLTGLPELTGLSTLTGLTSLNVGQRIPGDSLADVLPTGAALRQLFLGRGSTATTGLSGLDHFPFLERLTLTCGTAPLAADDWARLARLPALTELAVNGPLLAGVAPAGDLRGVREFRITVRTGTPDLGPFAATLPSVRTVLVDVHADSEDQTATDAHYRRLFPDARVLIRRL
ncbi:NACHT domain-containing protein [Streptomyces triticagri]|uniref:NACHT domain-containing protein n=1 Tax=Streptomyces triticagri TaxID=2293568 RepID=A0A372M483_9ACTN|nr:NACHT domain-containing protein [Streptomyces triticagri]RFU85734.1 NACHT domain-containing protein [Streptomyces triticagri]